MAWIEPVTPAPAGEQTPTYGFGMVPAIPGAPTGIPPVEEGFVAVVFDTVNQCLWVFSGGAWISSPFA